MHLVLQLRTPAMAGFEAAPIKRFGSTTVRSEIRPFEEVEVCLVAIQHIEGTL